MAKHRGKSSGVNTRNKVKTTKENPFEVRINKRRYDILGRKSKHEKGNPGVSRSRGLKKVSILYSQYGHRHTASRVSSIKQLNNSLI